jgi:hypothetical protein
MPDFTTTEKNDLVVAAILMMGALQKYFSYSMMLTCGIPTVTLLGEREDWAKMVKKLDKLSHLGEEPAIFASLLKPILEHFVACFDDSKSEAVLDFWGTCAHKISGGSGPTYLSGWVTAFCFWDENGKCLYPMDKPPFGPPDEQDERSSRRAGCELNGVLYHRLDTNKMPSSVASVPVKVNDNGTEYDTKMVAGLIGISASSSGIPMQVEQHEDVRSGGVRSPENSELRSGTSAQPGLDTIQPLSGWWMYEVEGPEEVAAREVEKQRIEDELHALDGDAGRGSEGRMRYYELTRRHEKLMAM